MRAATPIGMAVGASIVALAFVVSVVLGISGAYLLINSEINHQNAVERVNAVRNSIPICRALVEMDDASHPPVTNASNDPLSYGHKLSRAITDVVKTTRCNVLLTKLHNGESIEQITNELTPKGS